MRCSNCGVDVPPAWKLMIERNECPGCGGQIMDNSMKELLSDLTEALKAMPADPVGLAGWLVDNYKMVKIGSGEIINEFYGPDRGKKSKEEELKANPKISSNLDKFYKNAGLNPEKLKDMDKAKRKLLIQQISASEDNNAYDDEFEDHEDEVVEDDYAKKAVSVMNSSKISKSDLSKLRASEDLDEQSDVPHPLLQGDRLSRLEKQQSLSMGGVGLIKRSD